MRASVATAIIALLGLLAAPARAEEERVVLRWQAVPGAAAYDLQVAADPAFAHRELDRRVELAGYRLGPPPEARRYWRVRSVDADGRPGPWSATRVIEPRRAPTAEPAPVPEPEPPLLEVPPVPPAPLAGEGAEAGAGMPEVALGGPAPVEPPTIAPRAPEAPEGIRVRDALREGRPGVLVGWRANLLGVDALALTVEGRWPLPWLGTRWSAALRGGWWRERATVSLAGGLAPAFDASADVFPITALLLRSFDLRWARLYAGAGVGADLVLVLVPHQGALEASAAAQAIVGVGRRLGPGELLAEVGGSVGGVDGPLGRLRTGGLSVSLGYRLGR